MKTIEINSRWDTSEILGTAEVAADDPQPMRTAIERLVMAGRTPEQLRELRIDTIDTIDTEDAIVHADQTERQQLRWRIESIDHELASPGARANLDGAYLDGANLAGAYLARAYLARANLARANLSRANLAGANLARANLSRANLARANLARANLAGAYLDGAYLARANLARAYLARANLAGAKNLPAGLTPSDPETPYAIAMAATLAERARQYRERHPDVPVVEALDAKILAAVTTGGGKLKMSDWHTCGTTHCRGGWAIMLAGEAGAELEKRVGIERAAVMIYHASTGLVPWLFDPSDEHALEDIRQCAAAQVTEAAPP